MPSINRTSQSLNFRSFLFRSFYLWVYSAVHTGKENIGKGDGDRFERRACIGRTSMQSWCKPYIRREVSTARVPREPGEKVWTTKGPCYIEWSNWCLLWHAYPMHFVVIPGRTSWCCNSWQCHKRSALLGIKDRGVPIPRHKGLYPLLVSVPLRQITCAAPPLGTLQS